MLQPSLCVMCTTSTQVVCLQPSRCVMCTTSTQVVCLQPSRCVMCTTSTQVVCLQPSRCVMCTPCTTARHFKQKLSHIPGVHAYLAVTATCTWQNDRDLLRAAAEIQGWNRYRNKSAQKKTKQKTKKNKTKNHPPLLPGLEPATFRPIPASSPYLFHV